MKSIYDSSTGRKKMKKDEFEFDPRIRPVFLGMKGLDALLDSIFTELTTSMFSYNWVRAELDNWIYKSVTYTFMSPDEKKQVENRILPRFADIADTQVIRCFTAPEFPGLILAADKLDPEYHSRGTWTPSWRWKKDTRFIYANSKWWKEEDK